MKLRVEHNLDPATLARALAAAIEAAGVSDLVLQELLRSSDHPAAETQGFTGAMLALWLPRDAAAQLAVPGHEPPEHMHVTLLYLGDSRDFPPERRQAVLGAVRQVAAEYGPCELVLRGTSTFPPSESSDGMQVVYARVVSPDAMGLHDDLVWACEQIGVVSPSTFQYTPHVTLAYVPDGTVWQHPQPALRVVCPEIAVCFGDERTMVPLVGPEGAP